MSSSMGCHVLLWPYFRDRFYYDGVEPDFWSIFIRNYSLSPSQPIYGSYYQLLFNHKCCCFAGKARANTWNRAFSFASCYNVQWNWSLFLFIYLYGKWWKFVWHISRHAVCVEEFLLADVHTWLAVNLLKYRCQMNSHIMATYLLIHRLDKAENAFRSSQQFRSRVAFQLIYHFTTVCTPYVLYALNTCPTHWHERWLPRFYHLHMNLPSSTDISNSA